MQKTKIIKYAGNILFYLILSVAVLSCGSHIFIHINNMEQSDYSLQFDDGSIQQVSTVCSDNICKFIVLDTLGTPVVSKEFDGTKFKNVKFLPPNKHYDMLFIHIIKTKGEDKQFNFTVGDKPVTVYKNN